LRLASVGGFVVADAVAGERGEGEEEQDSGHGNLSGGEANGRVEGMVVPEQPPGAHGDEDLADLVENQKVVHGPGVAGPEGEQGEQPESGRREAVPTFGSQRAAGKNHEVVCPHGAA
jgi:hypothetical protein